MKRATRPALLGTSLLLSGCSLAPAYKPPAMAIPAAYKEAGPWQVAHPSDTLPRGPWWTAYDDPVLDGLESQVDARNPIWPLPSPTMTSREPTWRKRAPACCRR